MQLYPWILSSADDDQASGFRSMRLSLFRQLTRKCAIKAYNLNFAFMAMFPLLRFQMSPFFIDLDGNTNPKRIHSAPFSCENGVMETGPDKIVSPRFKLFP